MRDIWAMLLMTGLAALIGCLMTYLPDDMGMVPPTDEYVDYYPMGNTSNTDAKLYGWVMVDSNKDGVPDVSMKFWPAGNGTGAQMLTWTPSSQELTWWQGRH